MPFNKLIAICLAWIPACAGMTARKVSGLQKSSSAFADEAFCHCQSMFFNAMVAVWIGKLGILVKIG